MNWLSLLNGLLVTLFGGLLSAAFCGGLPARRHRWELLLWLGFLILVQGAVYNLLGEQFLRWLYPAVTHLPLVLVLWRMTRKPGWSVFAVLCAYLCCQLRRWLALLAAALLPAGGAVQVWTEILLTLPLLLLLHRTVTPAIEHLSRGGRPIRLHFIVIPGVYYLFDYLTVVYTDLLVKGALVAVEFMPFLCCLSYLVFLLYVSRMDRKEQALRRRQETLDLQLEQSVRQLDAMREGQRQAARYRHDLRHHLQYVSACLENGREAQAKAYISGICREIEAQPLQHYCENETADLILSAYARRCSGKGITLQVTGALPADLKVSDSDLCVLLSNGLENAVQACGPGHTVEVQCYTKEDRIFLQIVNPCETAVEFENGLPVSRRAGHGIGVESICAVVERYGGVYTFLQQKGQFILRLSI